MKIKKIKRNKIYFENGFELKINRNILISYNLKEGKELSEEEYKEMLYELAKNKAYFLLTKSSKTKEEIRRKLVNKFLDKNIVNKVIEKLEKDKYIDDYEYIESFIFSKKYGKARVVFELGAKGIDRRLIEQFYEENEINEKQFIEKYIPKVKRKSLEKIYGFFSRRGFSYEDIKDVLKRYDLGAEDEYS